MPCEPAARSSLSKPGPRTAATPPPSRSSPPSSADRRHTYTTDRSMPTAHGGRASRSRAVRPECRHPGRMRSHLASVRAGMECPCTLTHTSLTIQMRHVGGHSTNPTDPASGSQGRPKTTTPRKARCGVRPVGMGFSVPLATWPRSGGAVPCSAAEPTSGQIRLDDPTVNRPAPPSAAVSVPALAGGQRLRCTLRSGQRSCRG
jgi:hypothetical protein